jgi:hypothetical protein
MMDTRVEPAYLDSRIVALVYIDYAAAALPFGFTSAV